jgi:hypothetical protein
MVVLVVSLATLVLSKSVVRGDAWADVEARIFHDVAKPPA